jgi:hypothetical protein
MAGACAMFWAGNGGEGDRAAAQICVEGEARTCGEEGGSSSSRLLHFLLLYMYTHTYTMHRDMVAQQEDGWWWCHVETRGEGRATTPSSSSQQHHTTRPRRPYSCLPLLLLPLCLKTPSTTAHAHMPCLPCTGTDKPTKLCRISLVSPSCVRVLAATDRHTDIHNNMIISSHHPCKSNTSHHTPYTSHPLTHTHTHTQTKQVAINQAHPVTQSTIPRNITTRTLPFPSPLAPAHCCMQSATHIVRRRLGLSQEKQQHHHSQSSYPLPQPLPTEPRIGGYTNTTSSSSSTSSSLRRQRPQQQKQQQSQHQ